MHFGWWNGSLALGSLLAVILAMPAGAAGCAGELAARTAGMSVAGTQAAHAECIAELAARIDELESADAVPSGAVLAFDVTGRCPAGWSPFVAGQGRTIVGAAFGADHEPGLGTNAAGQPLAAYKYRDHGGVETVTLSPAQMPRHRHAVSHRKTGSIGGTHGLAAAADWGSQSTNSSDAGGGQPHDNMPPFIALYFCKKD